MVQTLRQPGIMPCGWKSGGGDNGGDVSQFYKNNSKVKLVPAAELYIQVSQQEEVGIILKSMSNYSKQYYSCFLYIIL